MYTVFFSFSLPPEVSLVSLRSVITWTEFIKRFGLSVNLSPQEWFCDFYPSRWWIKENGDSCINNWSTYNNTQSVLANASTRTGSTYPNFTPFTTSDIRRYHGLDILQVLYPYPYVYMKFNTQNKYPTNGNNAVASIFGSGAQNQFSRLSFIFGARCTK